jgi:hypothetical protein
MRCEGYNVVEKDIPPEYAFSRGWLCNAGKD